MADDRGDRIILIAPPLIILALHLATASVWGYFRDELYYLACADHLAFGYVDHPPLVALLARISRALLGDSLLAIRFLPAVAAAATVLTTVLMVRELGGRRLAQILGASASALAPVYLSVFGILSMNAYDILLWAVGMWVLIRLFRTGDQRWWLAFGLVAGIALQNKISMLYFGFGLVVGLALSRDRAAFTGRWLWLGGALSVLLFVPHLLWQAVNGWPTLEFIENATRYKNLPLSPIRFLLAQVMQLNPVTLPVWLGGLVYFLFARSGRPYRALGWTYVAVCLLMITQRSKPYYLSPIYPMLFAAGGVALEQVAARRPWKWLSVAMPVLVVLSGLVLAPLAKPMMPVDRYLRYAARLGQSPTTSERKELGRLGQFFADRFGWPELAATVAEVYQALPPEQRERACVFGQNYGQAGAIDLLGRQHGLPPAIASHNSYYLWGPGDCTGEVLIVIDGDREDLESKFGSVEQGAFYTCQDCMPYENNKPIWICRDLQAPLAELWPRLKHFN